MFSSNIVKFRNSKSVRAFKWLCIDIHVIIDNCVVPPLNFIVFSSFCYIKCYQNYIILMFSYCAELGFYSTYIRWQFRHVDSVLKVCVCVGGVSSNLLHGTPKKWRQGPTSWYFTSLDATNFAATKVKGGGAAPPPKPRFNILAFTMYIFVHTRVP